MLPVQVSGERLDWDTFGPRWEFAFNTVTCDTTGFTPFELDSGQPARTITSTLVVPRTLTWEPDEKKSVGIYGRIHEAAALYRQLASKPLHAPRNSSWLDSMNPSSSRFLMKSIRRLQFICLIDRWMTNGARSTKRAGLDL